MQSILLQQRLLAEESGWEAVLAIIRDEEVCERLRGRWQRDQGRLTSGDISCERWAELCAEIDKVLASVGRAMLPAGWPALILPAPCGHQWKLPDRAHIRLPMLESRH